MFFCALLSYFFLVLICVIFYLSSGQSLLPWERLSSNLFHPSSSLGDTLYVARPFRCACSVVLPSQFVSLVLEGREPLSEIQDGLFICCCLKRQAIDGFKVIHCVLDSLINIFKCVFKLFKEGELILLSLVLRRNLLALFNKGFHLTLDNLSLRVFFDAINLHQSLVDLAVNLKDSIEPITVSSSEHTVNSVSAGGNFVLPVPNVFDFRVDLCNL